MNATFDTTENFPAKTSESQMDHEVKLRLRAGAITSKYTGSTTKGWVLTTTWNILGQQ